MSMFKPGKLTITMDGGAGSSAKGLRAAYIWKHFKEEHTKIATNTYLENAAHTVTHDDGTEYVHQCLNSVTSLGGYDKQYLAPGCAFAESTFIQEMEKCGNPSVGVHPNAVIVTQRDIDYERGLCDFEGNVREPKARDNINLRIGSTLHGVGSARARRVLRRPDCVLAKDVPSIRPYVCDTPEEILNRLDRGESGIGEIAQGYQLSLMSRFYPRVTSRNCSVAAFLDDSLLPPAVIGPVVVNFRTFPIRVNSNKYIRQSDGKILTWPEVQACSSNEYTIIHGDSGGCYPDQQELTWEMISREAGEEICEITSLTKLPRRCYSFSKINLVESLLRNNCGTEMYISVNFLNYVDPSVKGKRTIQDVLTDRIISWIKTNILCPEILNVISSGKANIQGLFLGTWKTVDDSVFVPKKELLAL